jgi:predicted Kef-type K+ transport protein
VLFVVIGLMNHREGITIAGLARTALPLLGAWFVVALFTRTYSRPGGRTLLATWVIAIPIGVAIRAIALHRAADDSQVTFALVALIATLVLLLAWRAIWAAAHRRKLL